MKKSTAMEDITFQEAFEVFTDTLQEDEALYYAYQSNIAMAFYDAVRNEKCRISRKDLHRLSNEAAKNFLNLLIGRQWKSDKENQEGQEIVGNGLGITISRG